MNRYPAMHDNADRDPGKFWMLELQQGDHSALHRIVHHYGRRVIGFFQRFGADAISAEDLSQEVFLRIFRARDRYQPTARFSTWLYRILHRMAINEATRNRWRHAVSLHPQDEDDPRERGPGDLVDGEGTDLLHQLNLQEVRGQVRSAVAALPERQRTALLLNRFEGLSYEEVAEALGMRVPAVKSLLYRARENVKSFLAPLLREEHDDELPKVSDVDA